MPVMQRLLELISSLRRTDMPASELFRTFADRIRYRFGACGAAMICTEGLPRDTCRVLAFYDHHGNTIIENMDVNPSSDQTAVIQGTDRHHIFDPEQPIIHRGQLPGIHPLFGDLFTDYIDAISLPLFQHGGVNRWLLLLFTEKGRVDTIDIERTLLMATIATNYVFSVEDARHLEQANNWIRGELEAVARIQQLLLPHDLSNTPGIKVARFFRPHAYVGGDYYDIAPLSLTPPTEDTPTDANVWGFMIADASGHGAAAAVEIAMLDAILRTYRPNINEGPAGALDYANRYFFTRMLRGGYISAFVSSYHPQEKQLVYANAGHPPPYIKRTGSDSAERVDSSAGIPLGVDKHYCWDNAMLEMNPGDLLVLYTDGITEARSAEGVAFGDQQLHDTINKAPVDADQCLAAILTALNAHQGETVQGDDQTLLVIQAQ